MGGDALGWGEMGNGVRGEMEWDGVEWGKGVDVIGW